MVLRDDAVYDELHKGEGERKQLPVDEDLPGMGQYYCLHCDRYFASVAVRDEHFKTKRHRKRVTWILANSLLLSSLGNKSFLGQDGFEANDGPAPHTQLDAELAAGMGMPDNGPKLMST
ncbi:Zinc finger protein [Sesamum angolense]|uniref:Zinc finger protein n=1 Tax=Sesamum angolense TaxID=2727404 RepID=A0AAE1W4B1_9LAMI|nr:Zinc finger protein [Sesamum angolense]